MFQDSPKTTRKTNSFEGITIVPRNTQEQNSQRTKGKYLNLKTPLSNMKS